jgi:hypothetical protein
MTEKNQAVEKILEEFTKFQSRMEEIRLLRCVSEDLKSYRRMIRIKRYD